MKKDSFFVRKSMNFSIVQGVARTCLADVLRLTSSKTLRKPCCLSITCVFKLEDSLSFGELYIQSIARLFVDQKQGYVK